MNKKMGFLSQTDQSNQLRCIKCNKLLAKTKGKSSINLEIVCPRCKALNYFPVGGS
ncbi:Com family DNA-binding transcriptional regulator [Alkaliphilus crotonatoxidans]